MTNEEGDNMEIYDYVAASTLGEIEEVEQIFVNNDYIELHEVTHTSGGVMIKGYSHISGDNVFHILNEDQEVGLWAV